MAGALRIVSGLVIVGAAIFAGVLYRSPWIVLLLTVSFTTLYVGGKLPQWRALARIEGPGAVLKGLMVTLPIQAVLACVFYLVGVGVGALLGQRAFASHLETFDVTLAGALLALGLIATAGIHVSEAGAARNADPEVVLSAEIRAIMDEAAELGEQVVAMPVQIFSLARRLADHPDRHEALAAMDGFFDDDNAFVRRVAFTALRFMGQGGRDLDPRALDRRIIAGMGDAAVWVRYDAAWCAGDIKGDDAAFAAALREMIATAQAAGVDQLDANDAAHKALLRARASLEAIRQR
ncbi:hypothetical protein [Hyphomicrobium sp. CS1GBMeth3]|uniref:hypothetical protein n=1 Tax=Hyphomicrobium sp. CS1GBMeth3 TaxID=1892845 RepID=UPI000931E36F|nr:hypothetical protein [Hyphomicrobium sp. CS1GBMeth3]